MGRLSQADIDAGIKPKHPGSAWQRDLANAEAHKKRIDDDPPVCRYCGNLIPKPHRYQNQVAYCDIDHRRLASNERHKQRADEKRAALPHASSATRKGATYDKLSAALSEPEWDAMIDGDISDVELAKRIGSSAQAVGMARKFAANERIAKRAAHQFELDGDFAELLGPSDKEMRELLAEHPDVFEERLDTLLVAFVRWRTHFFHVGFETRYITKQVHERWIRATLKTIYTGGRLLILSPPRHGKTDLLIHFCVWLICRNPNIRILWVGPNGDIAENSLGQVRNLLETHEDLAEAYLPEHQSWAPARRGTGLWAKDKFTVETRTVQLKQPTMWSAGVSSGVLSLDADFIVVDDPADPDKSETAGGRQKIANSFKKKLITRKMDHTGLVMPSSRVHEDDLYSLYVDSESWTVIVDRAHDQSICHLDLWADHDDVEACVLFPEMNPLRYLREQADSVGEELFDMMYLNQPRPSGSTIFDSGLTKEMCFDYSRTIGLKGIKEGYKLVAGLDPAARGVQAAFLWAVQLPTSEQREMADRDPFRVTPTETYYMVDIETQKGGGIGGALKVMRSWHDLYDQRLWVIEDNAMQALYFDDPRLKMLRDELGLIIKPTSTGKNKHDADYGVAGMATLFHEGKINLPYGDAASQRKVDAYMRELVNFTGETGRSKHKSDILMASWFPFASVIRKWRRNAKHHKVRETSPVSYPDYDITDMRELPYPKTQYPI